MQSKDTSFGSVCMDRKIPYIDQIGWAVGHCGSFVPFYVRHFHNLLFFMWVASSLDIYVQGVALTDMPGNHTITSGVGVTRSAVHVMKRRSRGAYRIGGRGRREVVGHNRRGNRRRVFSHHSRRSVRDVGQCLSHPR